MTMKTMLSRLLPDKPDLKTMVVANLAFHAIAWPALWG